MKRPQEGQSMLEYALISATVVMAFAALSAFGTLQPIARQATVPTKNDYVVIPPLSDCQGQGFVGCIKTLEKDAQDINEQLRTR